MPGARIQREKPLLARSQGTVPPAVVEAKPGEPGCGGAGRAPRLCPPGSPAPSPPLATPAREGQRGRQVTLKASPNLIFVSVRHGGEDALCTTRRAKWQGSRPRCCSKPAFLTRPARLTPASPSSTRDCDTSRYITIHHVLSQVPVCSALHGRWGGGQLDQTTNEQPLAARELIFLLHNPQHSDRYQTKHACSSPYSLHPADSPWSGADRQRASAEEGDFPD